jgi:hypothetical protein
MTVFSFQSNKLYFYLLNIVSDTEKKKPKLNDGKKIRSKLWRCKLIINTRANVFFFLS